MPALAATAPITANIKLTSVARGNRNNPVPRTASAGAISQRVVEGLTHGENTMRGGRQSAILLRLRMVLDVLKVGDQISDLVTLQGDLRHLPMSIGYPLGERFLKICHGIAGSEVAQRRRGRDRALASRPDGMARRAPAPHECLAPRRRREVHRLTRIVSLLPPCGPLEETDRHETRARFAYAAQNVRLLAGSIAENLRLADPLASADDLWSVLTDACLADRVRALPAGLDTPLGENGDRLSGGERRRLGLARAYLRDAPWLVLDEPTEGLDAENEARVLAGLERRLASRRQGLIMVSHRSAPTALCDRVLTVSSINRNGRNSAQGLRRQSRSLTQIKAPSGQSV